MSYIYSNDSIVKIKRISGSIDESYFYELCIPDLDHLELEDQEDFYRCLSSSLMELNEGQVYKFYRWNGKKYIHFEKEEVFNSWLSRVNNPIRELYFNETTPTDIEFCAEYSRVGDEYWAYLEVIALPNKIYANILEEIDLDYEISVIRQSKLKSEILLARKQNSSDKLASTYHRNTIEEKKYRQAENLKEIIDDNQDYLFQYEIVFVVKSDSLDGLNELSSYYEKTLRERKIEVIKRRVGTKSLFERIGIGYFKKINSNFELSSYISNLLPMKTNFIHETGVNLNTEDNKCVFLDVFNKSEINPHMYITGKTGTGKSSFAGYYIYSYIKKYNANAIFIDLGGGLRRIANYLGGEDFSERINLNIFSKDINFLRDFIISIIGKQNLSRIEKGKIFEVIEEYILSSDEFNLYDLVDCLNNVVDGLKYYFSEYKSYFISGEEFHLPRICYINTDLIPDEILDAYLLYVRKLADQINGKTFIVWDECWKFAEKASYAISYAIKTDRKKDISNVFINQEYDNIALGENGLTDIVLSNINFKVIFDQTSNKKIVNQTDRILLDSKVYLEKGIFSQALIRSGKIRKIIKVQFNPFFYELTMTEREHQLKQTRFIEHNCQYLDYRTSFDKWVHYKYNSLNLRPVC